MWEGRNKRGVTQTADLVISPRVQVTVLHFLLLRPISIPSLCPYCASCIASVSLLLLTIHVTVYLYMLVLSTDMIFLHIVL